MGTFTIEGGVPLSGTLRIQGAKNAALPILAATVLAKGEHVLFDVPRLSDIRVMREILTSLGARVSHEDTTVCVDTTRLDSCRVPEDLMGQMRSSIFLMGPLLARFGEVTVSKPGGCAIGERRINLHLKGLEALGAKIVERNGYIHCTAPRLHGGRVLLDYPSVGATENIMMAAVKAKGTTVIINAAREPEIVDLQNFLNRMGARVRGAGTDTIEIEGVETLDAGSYRVIPDRIVAGTLLLAAAITGGEVTLTNVMPEHLQALIEVVRESGVEIATSRDIMRIKGVLRPKAVDKIVTAPFPGFPTDMQAQIMAYLSVADGTSIIKETVFDSRFKHVNELLRLGASIQVDLNSAFVRGVSKLFGARVEATDLRAGAALVLAGLAAEGTTVVEKIHHIDRGYDRLETQLAQLGANIKRTR
ncbi:UDP-N-acetylglucosamine 1-carboxyvinyltransferase [Bacillaceae bacterium]